MVLQLLLRCAQSSRKRHWCRDRVAIVLPNGDVMASAFVTIAQAATTAPLNPIIEKKSLPFILTIWPQRRLCWAVTPVQPRRCAATRDCNFASSSHSDVAGKFSLTGEGGRAVAKDELPDHNDIALILHTSGTTSRPKIVPLWQSNITASARNVAISLNLTTSDRCMNVMPLFHIHGLIAAVASSLSVGSSIWCTGGFNAMTFFASMSAAKPTWYTAVPTMHQAIRRASRNEDAIRNLRFLRSLRKFASPSDAGVAPNFNALLLKSA